MDWDELKNGFYEGLVALVAEIAISAIVSALVATGTAVNFNPSVFISVLGIAELLIFIIPLPTILKNMVLGLYVVACSFCRLRPRVCRKISPMLSLECGF
jgi:hypothetical protein